MRRREFLQTSALGASALTMAEQRAAIPADVKITRVRLYHVPQSRPIFNQSAHLALVDTDQGITGVGEGGSPDTVRQCGALLIGQNPWRIGHLWQLMYRAYFYPPGREKLHALGALDLALWDLKGKALGVPVHQLLGGLARDQVECYATAFPGPPGLKDRARACIEAGFRAFRTSVADVPGAFNSREAVRLTVAQCREVREGVGPQGDWAIDYHTRLDMPDAVRLSQRIEELEPLFVEDLIRSENPGVYRELRPKVSVPIAVGEHFGDRWEINELVEQRLIDYSRVTLPNCGGLTEFLKIAALCETHYVGLIPHFTGPIATAALVHACGVFSGPVLLEMVRDGRLEFPHLPQAYDFRSGRLWPNNRPGLGVEVDLKGLELVADVTEHSQPVDLFRRPDGSITNW
ncbi:MAG: mandelate racemase/muconate lactonizing enzyme family protein [Planctomycetaceae bacterium]